MHTLFVLGVPVAGGGLEDAIVARARRVGLAHIVQPRSYLPQRALFGQNNGLLILSRFPFAYGSAVESTHVSTFSHVSWEGMITRKGLAWAAVNVRGAIVHVFTCHLDAYKGATRAAQIGELRALMLQRAPNVMKQAPLPEAKTAEAKGDAKGGAGHDGAQHAKAAPAAAAPLTEHAITLGDFNIYPQQREHGVLTRALAPLRCAARSWVDYIFVSPGLAATKEAILEAYVERKAAGGGDGDGEAKDGEQHWC